MNKELTINAAIQLLPLNDKPDRIAIIDAAINIIQQSGLKYQVCPFETVVEGSFAQVVKLIESIKNTAFEHHAEEIIINLKLHCNKNESLYINDKMEQWQ